MKKYMHFEGLRGIAAFVVYLSHFKPTFCYDINNIFLDNIGITSLKQRSFYENFLSLLYEGNLPVFIFWLMSAYVISINLFNPEKNANNKYLVEASTKRYFRLAIPVFVSSLLAFILMKSNCLYNIRLAETYSNGQQSIWLMEWFNFVPDVFHFLKTTIFEVFVSGNCNYNLALWTMNPELLGSFLCFGLFAVIGKNRLRFLLYIFVSLFLIMGGLRDTTYFYYLVFVLGIAWCDSINSPDDHAYLKETIKKIFSSRITVIFLFFVGFGATIISDTIYPINKNLYFFFTFPVKALAFTLLINNFNFFKKLLSLRPFTFMGKISFSFYLIHIPLMFSLGIYLYMYSGIKSVGILFLILTLVSILIAYIFMRLVDHKSISISNKVGKYFSEK